MSLCPFATHRLLPENRYQPHITPYAAIWHSAVDAPGPTSLYGYFARADVGLESHFYIKLDGEIEQYMDTLVRADANYRANGFWKGGKYRGAISVETEDDGNPDQRIWTPAQVDSSIRLGRWIRDEHDIPPVLCPEWDAPGFGYHTLFPSMWTNVRGKTCPGIVRIPQFRDVILPAISTNTSEVDEEMMFTEGTDLNGLVVECYDRVVGRKPDNDDVRGAWAWTIAVQQGRGYAALMNALHYERRLREDARFEKLTAQVAALQPVGDTSLTAVEEAALLSKVYADLRERIS